MPREAGLATPPAVPLAPAPTPGLPSTLTLGPVASVETEAPPPEAPGPPARSEERKARRSKRDLDAPLPLAERRRLHAALEQQARGGDPVATEALRHIYRHDLALREQVGNPAAQARAQWIAVAAAGNAALAEVLQEKLDALAAELRGPEPSAVEALLADRAALCWLHLSHVERRFAEALRGPSGSGGSGGAGGAKGKPAAAATLAAAFRSSERASASWQAIQEYNRWVDRAHRRYLSSLKTLATVRRLLVPAVQVNIADRQVNVAAGAASSPSPST